VVEAGPPAINGVDLYHAALEVRVPEGRFVIEVTPIPDGDGEQRGVVGEGPVGSRWASRFRLFATRCVAGGTVSSPTTTRRSRARGD
jgi:hypothetical protein